MHRFSSILAALCFFCNPTARAERNDRVDVILWFDTEDYLLPKSDDAAKRLAQMLTERKIRATFKVVGEKARVLESRGRRDVIGALKKHDIAYHTDLHSVHPTPTEYLADCGLSDGIEEFIRREGNGAEDVKRIFSVRTLGCYGQPGSSWAPQAMAALSRIGVNPHGVPCYVDDGSHVGLEDKPFWYMGVLTVYNLGKNTTRMELHDPAAVVPAQQEVSAIAERLRSDGGGLISIYYHPCEWAHRQFWDGVNFSRGANPPRERWQIPPERTPGETDAAFERFGQYIDHIRAIPGIRFVTATDLPPMYPDQVQKLGAGAGDLDELASTVLSAKGTGLNFRVMRDKAYSLADQFELLTTAVAAVAAETKLKFPLRTTGLLGPDTPQSAKAVHVEWTAFRAAVADVEDFIAKRQGVPSRVFIGADAVAPGDFLVGLAEVWTFYRAHGRFPTREGVDLGTSSEILPARHIAKDTPGLFGGWVIHKENFRAPKLMELARLQAWTLKPALRAD